MRQRYASRRFTSHKQRSSAAAPTASPASPPSPPLAYLVTLAHDIPADSLQSMPTYLWPRYTATLPRGAATLSEGTIVIARVTRGRLSLHSVPSEVRQSQASLAYDILVPARASRIDLASVLGFTIFTQPTDFFNRACTFLNAGMLKDALGEYDLAITLCAERAALISDSLETQYERYAKLRNLALYSSESHESALACKHALRAAASLWVQLTQEMSA